MTLKNTAPWRWLAGKFPGLEFRDVFLTISASVLLILFLYQGKPSGFFKYMPQLAGDLIPAKAGLASWAWSHLMSFFLLFITPLVIITAVFKEKPSEYGLNMKGASKEFIVVLVMYLLFLPLLLWIAQTPAFQAKYPKLKIIKDNFGYFAIYQALYLIKWVSWEFFFRGFLLFGFKKNYGEGAILLSTMPFVIVHLGKPQGEIFGAIAAGFILCRLSLDGRSIFPGVWLHFMVAGTMDFLTCNFWR
ncbi:CPBP family intramembrane metalloprotease [Myxococcota bacterium]|nr:CPBP family intramembrane metalloprotease [Myxococcota bacterium]MBU1382347.1 CPBP family intramembrane metalloprotease [Myxococcota bacterium]MBU1496427.1 CPBP family intramembrane metalloprotease [Myxococcota bacterium]